MSTQPSSGVSAFGSVAFAHTWDGRKLQYMTAIPTRDEHPDTVVVFESGLGSAHTFWGLVQAHMATHVRTIVYCRAGYGRSDIDLEPRTVARMAKDLHAMIVAATADQPSSKVILVGHSLGAAIVAHLAATASPAIRIAGLVLVDGVWADMPALRGSAYRRSLRLYAGGIQALAHLGVTRWITRALVDSMLPGAYADEAKSYELTVAATRSRARETQGWIDDLTTTAARTSFPNIPAIVLSAARTSLGGAKTHADIIKSHQQVAHNAARGKHRIIESSHNMLFDRPQAITEAINDVLNTWSVNTDPPCDPQE
ncbi:alpha/beta hydrolase fold protein [Mycolicibacterium canariasense]|uniref:Alpha/beta hydrolase fold protein n=1 Tax=Mycolicibacterium canariasense TaxID=228230 RepID=A0A100WI98_MYCCR|nr:alpha/beta hydrolase [Mycolicibacterium canariasense]MCV7211165.1 alpha/beta fold hydrolase [Mycolicibacterium canariasense]ORV09333.1 hypothetical protein AWB94_10130 [Mycolicibacterium canariasense]GAS98596.1 alpha/beta hydrolase fold protein [Mycolicibacterium canariasense]